MLNHPYIYLMMVDQCTNNNIPNRILIFGSSSANGINALVSLRISKLSDEEGHAVPDA